MKEMTGKGTGDLGATDKAKGHKHDGNTPASEPHLRETKDGVESPPKLGSKSDDRKLPKNPGNN